MYKIIVTDDRFGGDFSIEKDIFGSLDADLEIHNLKDEAEGKEILRDADAVLVVLYPMTAGVIRSLRKCRIISRYGVGFDNVDVAAATEKGIWVSRVPDFSLEDVSDHALGLLLTCIRGICFKDRKIRNGKWNIECPFPVSRIAGKTLGLIGYGNIARTLHRKVGGLGLGRVLAFDPFVGEGVFTENNALKVDLPTLLSESDYISIHVPLSKETTHLLGKNELARVKKEAIIINTSRGPIIDEAALCVFLKDGLGCAGLDVFETEPLPGSSPLRKLSNIVLTDHSAWYSRESVIDLKTKAAKNIIEVLRGGKPLYPVNMLR